MNKKDMICAPNLSEQSAQRSIVTFFKQTGILWALVALVVVMSVASPAFLTPRNILNVLKQSSITGILSVGMMMVIVTGGIDLSVGSVMAVSCMVAAFCTTSSNGYAPLPVLITFVLGIAAGAVFGAFNGYGVAYIGFAPFVITMATLSAARGIALVTTNSKSVFNLSEEFIAVANSTVLGIPALVYYWFVVVVIFHVVMKKTVFGKWVYAIGGNEDAATLSGIPVKKIKLIVYTLAGALVGLTGVLMASRVTSGQPTIGDGYELDAIASCVIGGVSMSGGSGSVLGTVVGVLILSVISNGFDILGIPTNYQRIMKGVVILLAVFIDIRSKAKKRV